MQIVLDTRGLQLSVKNHCFFIEAESQSRLIHPARVGSFLITAPCRISSPALLLAAENQIPVTICNNCGKPEARLWSPRFLNTSALRRSQYHFTQHEMGLAWARDILKIKIEGQIANLRYLANRRTSLAGQVDMAIQNINQQMNLEKTEDIVPDPITKKQLLFYEAYVAARYWALIGIRLPVPFTFTTRVKRNPIDAFNACINYLYGMLRNETETAVLSVGLDPALGVIHRDGYRLPSLVFDLMEPFRPIMDKTLLSAVFDNQFKVGIIEPADSGHRITKEGRHELIELFTGKLYGRVQHRGNLTALRNQILNEARLLTGLIRKS